MIRITDAFMFVTVHVRGAHVQVQQSESNWKPQRISVQVPCNSIIMSQTPSTSILGTGNTSTSLPAKSLALSDEDFLQTAKEYISNPTPDKLSNDFIFRGPVIGPLCKADFVAILASDSSGEAGLCDAFSDLQPNAFAFSVDPTESGHVWYFERPRGTFDGPFDHPVVGRIEPTGAKYVGPPEARSVILDPDGKVRYQSVGYVVDRFTGDTTGGRGAVFGMYAVMGEELDDTVGSPIMVFLQWLSSILPEGMVPKSYSKKEDLPLWWKDERMGSQK